MPTAQQFESELRRQLKAAQASHRPYVDIQAGELHRQVGDYPDPDKHRMPVCCEVMRSHMKSGDMIVQSPPRGNGASLMIRYKLPR